MEARTEEGKLTERKNGADRAGDQRRGLATKDTTRLKNEYKKGRGKNEGVEWNKYNNKRRAESLSWDQ